MTNDVYILLQAFDNAFSRLVVDQAIHANIGLHGIT